LEKVAEYLFDLRRIIKFLGFKDTIIFIDEADHLPEVDQFLKLLTRSREVLFTKDYTFFIAGSVEIVKYTEAMGTIFDKLIFLRPATLPELEEMFTQRIQAINSKLQLYDMFSREAVEKIFHRSKGVRKQALRLAENALEKASIANATKVDIYHLEEVIRTGYDEVTMELSGSQIKILKFLARVGAASPSDVGLQKKVGLGRTRIRGLLEELLVRGYVQKEKQGKQAIYKISSQYQAYFAKY
jgi:Holliday junction resolvasome RuvABC ATP-dependent DNA helicase subunit